MSDRWPPRVLLVEEVGLGGIAEYTNELAQALVRAGCEVQLATARDHDATATPDAIVHRVFPYIRGGHPLGRLVRRLHLARALNGAAHLAGGFVVAWLARGCDVVHVQGEEWPPLGAIQALLLRAARRPVVYTPHNTFDRGDRSYARAHRLIRRSAARIVVHSEYDRRALSASQARKAVVIPHGEYGGLARRGGLDLDPEAARAELGVGHDELRSGPEPLGGGPAELGGGPEELGGGPEELGGGHEEVLVLLFGQLRRDKGVRDLLEAAAEVQGVRVLLAGEDRGALAEAADLLADPRLCGRVLVRPGFASDEQVSRLFAAADVVALPYPQASASGVLLLAYGYRRPVLAYPVGGLPEYVLDGRTGWLCERADATALADRLRTIVAAGREECRARGEDAGRFSQEHFGWDAIAKQTIALYGEALARSCG